MPNTNNSKYSNTVNSELSEQKMLVLPEDLILAKLAAEDSSSSGYMDMAGANQATTGLKDFEESVEELPLTMDEMRTKLFSERAHALTDDFFESYSPDSFNVVTFRGDGRYPNEVFYTGFGSENMAKIFKRSVNMGITVTGGVSTPILYRVPIKYFVVNGGFLYVIKVKKGIKLPTFINYTSLDEIFTLRVEPEDIAFALGPFNIVSGGFNDMMADALHINPNSTVALKEASNAYLEVAHLLRSFEGDNKPAFQLAEERMSFAERYNNRSDYFMNEDKNFIPAARQNQYFDRKDLDLRPEKLTTFDQYRETTVSGDREDTNGINAWKHDDFIRDVLNMNRSSLSHVIQVDCKKNIQDGRYIYVLTAQHKMFIRPFDRLSTNDQGNKYYAQYQNNDNFRGDRYLHVRHSQLNSGWDSLYSAGEMKIIGGVILVINNESGHFKPDKNAPFKASLFLERLGYDTSKAKIGDFRFNSAHLTPVECAKLT